MKKFLSILVVLAVVSGGVMANGIDNPKANTGLALMKSEKGFKVFYKGSKAGTVRVTITNSKGEHIHQETLKNVESFMRPYNLSSITEGEYTIEINSPDGKQIEKFSYSKNKVEKLMNLLHVKDADGKYVLTVSNKNGSDRLTVNIYDQNYNLVYTGTEEISGDFAKIYDLRSLGKNFTFEVKDGAGSTQTLSSAK
ncbi:MAG TPA: hypothetical protein VGD40_03540 [Chryseosolibacter sp.]